MRSILPSRSKIGSHGERVAIPLVLAAVVAAACTRPPSSHEDAVTQQQRLERTAGTTMKGEDQDPRTILASRLREDGIRDAEVLRAIATVRRDRFVPPEHVSDAYEDRPLPIGSEQTISQPFVVAYMTELLTPLRGKRVLEVGTGSGYQAAVLAELGAEVFSIEILPELSTAARAALTRAGYERVELRVGDGYAGWSERAPFDRILVAAAADAIPRPLVAQLAGGGRLVMPVEDADTGEQWIRILDKGSDGSTKEQRAIAVRFVPMTGEAERR